MPLDFTKGSKTLDFAEKVIAAAIWTLFETLSPAGVATINSSALPVHDLWMVVIDLTITDDAETGFYMRLNNDSGNNYRWCEIDATTIFNPAAASGMKLGSGIDDKPMLGIIYVGGKSQGDDGRVQVIHGVSGAYGYDYMIHGDYDADADITLMTFYTPTFTGKIKIYYMDY